MTNPNQNQPAFKRDEFLDKPGIVGARWWHEGLKNANPVGRRAAVGCFILAGGALMGLGLLSAVAASCGSGSSSDESLAVRGALEMQKEYGWNFGAPTESLTFDGGSKQPFQRELIPKMPDDLRPANPRLRPYFVLTLFQSPTATPTKPMPAGETAILPLIDALSPISTPAMELAYRRGKALASLFDKRVSGVAVVVDLPGPEAVAFAAGAASTFDPVFTFDNWPHPRGVVAAHHTLGAAAYYQPLFARTAASRPSNAPAMFVLDRNRLAPYTDEANQFDNRHLARLPASANLTALGIKRVLYVTPSDVETTETDDLNDDFVQYLKSGIPVKIVSATSFTEDPAAKPGDDGQRSYFYGGSTSTHDSFWNDYPWATPVRAGTRPASLAGNGKNYVPTTRTTPFTGSIPATATGTTGTTSGTTGSDGTYVRARPAGFGTVPVVIAVATGAVLISRSGSWNRSSGGYGG